MLDEDTGPEKAYERITDRIAESVLDASDEEIREEIVAAGEDPDESAERLRAVLLDVVRRYRERRGR